MLHVVSHRCLFSCINVSPSVQTVIAEKLTHFQLTKKFLYCLQPELSLPYMIQLINIKIRYTVFKYFSIIVSIKCFPRQFCSVMMEWCPLRLCMEEQHPGCRVAVNILNKQSRTVYNGW
jgi:hypothetical protein